MSRESTRRSFASACLAAAVAALAAAPLSSALAAAPAVGAVYVLSNQAAGNSVQVFTRARDGSLSFDRSVPTGGTGTIAPPLVNGPPGIDPLGSQNSVVYSNGLLFAVNAGSNDISMFRADAHGLALLDRVSSGGVTPVSLAVRGRLLYVVNQGGTPNVSGFHVDAQRGRLVAMPGSTRALPGGATSGAGQVGISPDGEALVVTEKGKGMIDVFSLDDDGYAGAVTQTASPGKVPFGFSITKRETLAVAEAGSGSASSFDFARGGALKVVSGAVSLDGQAAPCWLVTSPDGRYAFTGNAGTQAISSLAVGPDGALTLVYAVAGSVAGAALDLGLSSDGEFLYVREATGTAAALPGGVSAYKIEQDSSLSLIGTLTDLQPGSQGIAVR